MHGREELRQRGSSAARTTESARLRTAARSADAFMAWAWRAAVLTWHGMWRARWRQHADERAQCGEREADMWDPAVDFSLN
jgi:hypothetical protein